MSYVIPDGPQGGLKRFAVVLRVTGDLTACPSTDEVTTHVIWADDPYDAMCAAEIISRRQRGQHLRRVIGVEEYPVHPVPGASGVSQAAK
ncbi:hypothetical protein HLB42_21630 (plasmid) [Deinococcus sp. D7000]|nr:hypothetical protein HLB42_13905 [Deinococcus sp. D7000]QLG13543.1 hypothetical protein HLB42_21630 [Deinococcus sp. D7000]